MKRRRAPGAFRPVPGETVQLLASHPWGPRAACFVRYDRTPSGLFPLVRLLGVDAAGEVYVTDPSDWAPRR